MNRLRGPLSAVAQLPRRRASSGAVVLGYHDVAEQPDGASGMTVDRAQLANHLTTLKRFGFRVVSLDDLADRLESNEPVDGLAAITFDDALLGVHRHALPVLAEHQAPATLFVVAGCRGELPPWWPEASRTLTEDELHEVSEAGHLIGSHTMTHHSLPDLDDNDQTTELRLSRETLRSISGQAVDHLAYPSGHHDPSVRDGARAAGYRTACTFLNGRVSGQDDRWMLPRLTMGAHVTPTRLAYHLLRSAASWPDHQLEAVGPETRS